MQIVGRTVGRSEFTYCLTPTWGTDCDSGTATISVRVVPAWTDARYSPADSAAWARINPTNRFGVRSGSIDFFTRGPPDGGWRFISTVRTSGGRGAPLGYCFWDLAGSPCSLNRSWGVSIPYRGAPEHAVDYDDLIVFYDGATRVHELPCLEVPGHCTTIRGIDYGNRRNMRLGVVGATQTSDPAGGSMPFTATGPGLYGGLRGVHFKYTYGYSYWLRTSADRTITNTVEYCLYWHDGDHCATSPPSCVRWTAPGMPNEHLPRAADTLCDTATWTFVVSTSLPPPPAPGGFTPDCVNDADLTHILRLGGHLIVKWEHVDSVSTYEVSRNGEPARHYTPYRWRSPVAVFASPADGVHTLEVRTVRHGLYSPWVTHTVTKPCPPDIDPPTGLVCTVAPGGRTTLRWSPALNAERYRLRLAGDDTQILPVAGWADLTTTSWSWSSNPNTNIEVAGGLLSGTWSAWSAPFDMSTACPPPPPLAALALCVDSGTTLRWTPPAGVARTEILWLPYSTPTITVPAADPPELAVGAGATNVDIWAYDASSTLLAQELNTQLAALAACAPPPPPPPPPLNPDCLAEIAAPHRLVESAYASDRTMFADLVTLSSVGQGIREKALSPNCASWSWAITAITPCDTACAVAPWNVIDAAHVAYIADIRGRAATLIFDEPADLAGAASCASAAACNPSTWKAEARGAYEIEATFQPPDYPDPNDPLITITPPPEVRHDLVWIERRIARQ